MILSSRFSRCARASRVVLLTIMCSAVAGTALAQFSTMVMVSITPYSPYSCELIETWYESDVQVTASRPSAYDLVGPTWTLDWIKDVQFKEDGDPELATLEWGPADSTNCGVMCMQIVGPTNSDPAIDVIYAKLSFTALKPGDLKILVQKGVEYANANSTWTGRGESEYFVQTVIRYSVYITSPQNKSGPSKAGTKVKLVAKGFAKGPVAVTVNSATAKNTNPTYKLYTGAGMEVQQISSPGPNNSFEFIVEFTEDLEANRTYYIGVNGRRRDAYTTNP